MVLIAHNRELTQLFHLNSLLYLAEKVNEMIPRRLLQVTMIFKGQRMVALYLGGQYLLG